MTQAVVDQSAAQLTGLLLTLSDRLLLLPNTAVAELVAYRHVQPAENSPNWLLGQISWRDLNLPLLSFEAASSDATVVTERARVVIVNAIGGRPKFRYFGLLIQGIPRSTRIDESLLSEQDETLLPLELDAVNIEGEIAKIPDLIALEQKLADLDLI
ncbi:chemotaxis protein CheW [Pseudomonas sp. C27(2019)]|uniref:chemotaxis protein CheW n=1 Tax=Pseudomonas sp. C27(2019) TaxID=2604941 RepID=UPI001243BDA3|nr:chemotaxis protein CheW [Pseudomonas sp. C27(2019)]QEY59942.1 chemotaxis protein CheW [Pseudomonas sp. C27(2019)]